MFDIIFYQLPNGSRPVEEFILNLNVKMRVKALDSLMILKDKGNILREPYSKHIQDGIFELRIKFSSDITRIFYFFYKGNKIILTNGYVKKTQKTPDSEIELAKKYKKHYENNN